MKVNVSVNWTKARIVIVKVLDFGLLFSAGALLDPGVHQYLGEHQGVATGVALVILALRAGEKALGAKAAPPPIVPEQTQ